MKEVTRGKFMARNWKWVCHIWTQDTTLTPGERTVLTALLAHINFEKDEAWPSHRRLCKICGVGKTSLKRHLTGLVEKKWLKIAKGRTKNGALKDHFFIGSIGPPQDRHWSSTGPAIGPPQDRNSKEYNSTEYNSRGNTSPPRPQDNPKTGSQPPASPDHPKPKMDDHPESTKKENQNFGVETESLGRISPISVQTADRENSAMVRKDYHPKFYYQDFMAYYPAGTYTTPSRVESIEEFYEIFKADRPELFQKI